MTDAKPMELDAGDIVQFIYDPQNPKMDMHTKPCPCLVLGSYPVHNQTFVLMVPGRVVGPKFRCPTEPLIAHKDEFKDLGQTPGIIFDCETNERILVSSDHSRFVRQANGLLRVCSLNGHLRDTQISDFEMTMSIFINLSADGWLYELLAPDAFSQSADAPHNQSPIKE